MGHDGLTLRGCQHIGTQTDDTARRDVEFDIHTFTLILHGGHLTFAAGHHINHLRGKLLGHVDGQFLYRFTFLAIDLLIDHLRLSYLQLIALTTHGLDEHREVQHATTGDHPFISRVLERLHTQGKVLLQFLLQTVIDMTRGHELTLFTEERRVVDHEEHRHGRFVDGNRRHGLRILQVTDGVANLKLLQSNDGTDITAIDTLRTYMRHTLKSVQFLDLCLLQRPVTMGDGHLHAVLQLSTVDTTYGDTSLITRIVERGDQHLRCTLNLLRGGNHLNDLIQQISDIVGRRLPVLTHPAVLR